MPDPPRVTFWGAARSVTGSMHLVEAAGRRVLLDCGLVRGLRAPPRAHDGHFPFDPRGLDAVVVSHAHIDHCGNLPLLAHHGFAGPVYCTPATRDLLALVLANSARIQEEDAFVRGVVAGGDGPLFTRSDASRALLQCVAVGYDEPREIAAGLRLTLTNAGHILGSAVVHLAAGGASLTFTGDLGRFGSPVLRPPAPVPAADLVVSESTYGGRVLDPPHQAAAALEEVITRTADRGGRVLIPSFSLGRMQAVLDVLRQALAAGRVPAVPVFVDSSFAADIEDVYRRHGECLVEGAAERLGGDGVQYLRSREESAGLDDLRGPCVILAPGGMCEGGRILHHLKRHVDDPRCSVVLVNYQAPNTPGRRLLERGPTVRFHGRKWNKWADVIYLAGFSGHADHDDLLAQLGPLARRARRVRLVHGEVEQSAALAGALRDRGFADVAIPERGETAAWD